MSKIVDLDSLDYTELQALIAEARVKSETKLAESLSKAVDAAKAELERHGFTIGDLIDFVGAKAATKGKGRKARDEGGRGKVAPKYRDPANPGSTWAGRGRSPRWLVDKLAAGAKLEDFAIKAQKEGADR